LSLIHVKNMELLLLAGATLIAGEPEFLFRRENDCGAGGHRRCAACWITLGGGSLGVAKPTSRRAGPKKSPNEKVLRFALSQSETERDFIHKQNLPQGDPAKSK
jgi:hypothetical protein